MNDEFRAALAFADLLREHGANEAGSPKRSPKP